MKTQNMSARHMRSDWDLLSYSAWRSGGCGEASWWATAYSQGEQRHWFLLSGYSDKTQGNGMELCQARIWLGIRKRFFTREVGQGSGMGSPGWWFWPQAARVQGVFGYRVWISEFHYRAKRWSQWCLCVPSNLDILWFYAYIFSHLDLFQSRICALKYRILDKHVVLFFSRVIHFFMSVHHLVFHHKLLCCVLLKLISTLRSCLSFFLFFFPNPTYTLNVA